MKIQYVLTMKLDFAACCAEDISLLNSENLFGGFETVELTSALGRVMRVSVDPSEVGVLKQRLECDFVVVPAAEFKGDARFSASLSM